MIRRTHNLDPITKNLASVLILSSLLFLVWSMKFQSAAAADVTPTSITVTWTAPGDNGTEGIAAEYDIRYSTVPVGMANWDNIQQAAGEPTPQPCGSIETFTITDLIPDTWYYIAMMTADDAYNWSDISNIVAVRTLSLSLDVDDDLVDRIENILFRDISIVDQRGRPEHRPVIVEHIPEHIDAPVDR